MASWLILSLLRSTDVTARIFGLMIECFCTALMGITMLLLGEFPANLIFGILFLIDGVALSHVVRKYRASKETDPEMYEWEFEGDRDRMGADENHEQYQQELVDSLIQDGDSPKPASGEADAAGDPSRTEDKDSSIKD